MMFSWQFIQMFYGYSPQLSTHLLVCSQQVALPDYFSLLTLVLCIVTDNLKIYLF